MKGRRKDIHTSLLSHSGMHASENDVEVQLVVVETIHGRSRIPGCRRFPFCAVLTEYISVTGLQAKASCYAVDK